MQHLDEAKWYAWFFRTHSPAELKEWTARMRFFRFYRAIGGHANDGDTLRCALRVETEADLLALTSNLGISLRALPDDEPQPVVGQRYTIAEFDKFRCRMESFPRFEQLGRITLASVECSAHVWDTRLELRIIGAADPYEIREEDAANAIRVEEVLLPFSDRVTPPPLDDKYCFLG
jgi:hypothetical protein